MLLASAVLISVYYYAAAQNPNSPCYDRDGKPLRCEPVFSNIAYGLPVSDI